MKTMRISVPFLVLSFLATPLLRAQDFSKYRSFALGTNLATVLKNTDQKSADVKETHTGSVLFQELTWWPANRSAASNRSESVEQMLFSFYRGELDKEEGPQREAARQKKKTDALEVTRQKNQKSFRP